MSEWRWAAVLLLVLLGGAARGSARPGPSPGSAQECAGEGGARAAGEPCGVYTPGCARGLRCVPRPGEKLPLQALLRGRGLCATHPTHHDPHRNHTHPQEQPHKGGNGKMTHRVGHSTPEPLPLQSQAPQQDVSISKTQLQQLSLSADAKQEFDMAPCRRHLTAILQELKAPLYLNGEDIFIPNCDTKGFYRRKQCRASKGQKRGQCWCVDKRGRRLEEQEENPLCLLANND